MIGRVPKAMRSGWSFFDKSAEMDISDYVSVLKSACAGKGNWEEVLGADADVLSSQSSIFFALTPRQRSIMLLCDQSKSPREIATHLGLSYSYVRKELSRSYSVLVPDAKTGDDVKTAAILKYIELTAMA
jgi:DNA-binding NarL/FixJ family response regulator